MFIPGTASCSDTQFADEEIMDHITGLQRQHNLARDGHAQRGDDDVILAGRIARIQAQRIAPGIADQLQVRASELPRVRDSGSSRRTDGRPPR